MTGPNFAKLTLKELVEAFNKYTGKTCKSLFANKAEGVKAVEAAYAAWSAGTKITGNNSERRKDCGAAIVMKAKKCPYLRGNVARSHYAEAQVSRTIGDYLARFEEGEVRRYARAWLGRFVRDGHIKLDRRG